MCIFYWVGGVYRGVYEGGQGSAGPILMIIFFFNAINDGKNIAVFLAKK